MLFLFLLHYDFYEFHKLLIMRTMVIKHNLNKNILNFNFDVFDIFGYFYWEHIFQIIIILTI